MDLDWNTITKNVVSFVNDGAPIAEQLLPEYAPAIQIGAKLLTGAANAEPAAVDLVNTIRSGQMPSPADLQQFATDYEDSYQALHADIAARLASTPAPASVS